MSDKYTIENARQNTIDICKKEIESLQSQLKQKDNEIDKLYDIIQAKNIEESFIKSELIGVTEQLKEKNEEIREVIEYCLPHHNMMWASNIMGILLDCDFRESVVKANEWLEKTRR